MDEVTPWKVGADEKLLLRDWSLWMRLLLGKWVLTRSCYSETGLCGLRLLLGKWMLTRSCDSETGLCG